MISTGSQSKVETKEKTSQSSPEMFDLTVNDNLSKVKQDIESVENTQQQNRQQQEQQISRILQNHLQHEATPDTTINCAHKMASMASSGIKTIGSIASQGIEHLSSSSPSQEPSLLLGDPKGKQDWYTMNPPQLNLGDKPKLVPIQFNPKPNPTPQPKPKPKPREIDDAVEKVNLNQKQRQNL